MCEYSTLKHIRYPGLIYKLYGWKWRGTYFCMEKILWGINLLLGRDLKTVEYRHCYATGRQTNICFQAMAWETRSRENNIQSIARQPLSVGSAPRLYNEDASRAAAQLPAIQLREVTWSSWLVSSLVSWKSACEEKTRRLVWNGCQPGTQLPGLLVDKSSVQAAVTRGSECGKLKNLPW
jgi:hypothetical protein